jgi:antitoxin Phd
MSKLTFRNSHGSLVDIPTITATKFKNEFGAILERVTRGGAVVISRHKKPKAVLICCDEFESLVKARSHTLDDLSTEFNSLLVRMQTPKARRGMEAAFNASSAQLGRAAVNASRKRR